jgi:AcrR family transcriptional regulator
MPKVSQEHLDSRKRQILAAANRCFARVGFHNATMQDVIKESALSAGAIYNYFSSKEDIIIAIAEERHVREAAICRAAECEADPFAALTHLAREFFDHLSDAGQDEERRVGVQLWAEALNNKRLLSVNREGSAEPLRALIGIIERLKAYGEISHDIGSDALARVMIALFQGLVLQKCREKDLLVQPYIKAVLFLAEGMRGRSGKSRSNVAEKAKGTKVVRDRRNLRGGL